ncbi:hypothetical protein JXA32_15550 [Candidatus Sumerlaeota bacterium]|nr:hypothetical protein [Candidatus Sumerlaeota bacterium]
MLQSLSRQLSLHPAGRNHRWRGRIAVALLAAAPMFLAGCHSRYTQNPRYAPQQTLLEIIADMERHRNLDPYCFPPPKDLSGQNVWRAALVRLTNYETLHPDRHRDIVLFAQAGAYERLRDYATARERYSAVAASGGELAPEAVRRVECLERLISVQRRHAPQDASLRLWLDFKQEQADRWRELSREDGFPDPLYVSLCKVEWESAECEWRRLLWKNRDVIENGAQRAMQAMNGVIERHAQSRLAEQHHLTLGLWQFELAREYTQVHPPEGLDFDPVDFNRITALARREFLGVESCFGSSYRPEAEIQRAALDAFIERIREESR